MWDGFFSPRVSESRPSRVATRVGFRDEWWEIHITWKTIQNAFSRILYTLRHFNQAKYNVQIVKTMWDGFISQLFSAWRNVRSMREGFFSAQVSESHRSRLWRKRRGSVWFGDESWEIHLSWKTIQDAFSRILCTSSYVNHSKYVILCQVKDNENRVRWIYITPVPNMGESREVCEEGYIILSNYVPCILVSAGYSLLIIFRRGEFIDQITSMLKLTVNTMVIPRVASIL